MQFNIAAFESTVAARGLITTTVCLSDNLAPVKGCGVKPNRDF